MTTVEDIVQSVIDQNNLVKLSPGDYVEKGGVIVAYDTDGDTVTVEYSISTGIRTWNEGLYRMVPELKAGSLVIDDEGRVLVCMADAWFDVETGDMLLYEEVTIEKIIHVGGSE